MSKYKKKISRLLTSANMIFLGLAQVYPPGGGGNPFARNAPYPSQTPPPTNTGPIQDVSSVFWILGNIINFAEMIFWILTVGFGLYGAYLYLFSAGNKESAQQARRVFIYAFIAGILAIASYGLPSIIQTVIGG